MKGIVIDPGRQASPGNPELQRHLCSSPTTTPPDPQPNSQLSNKPFSSYTLQNDVIRESPGLHLDFVIRPQRAHEGPSDFRDGALQARPVPVATGDKQDIPKYGFPSLVLALLIH